MEKDIDDVKVRVFDEVTGRDIDKFDVVCSNTDCMTLIASPYKGNTSSISKKCSGCRKFVNEYTAVAVEYPYGEHATSSKALQRKIEKRMEKFLVQFFELHENEIERSRCEESALEHGYDVYNFVESLEKW